MKTLQLLQGSPEWLAHRRLSKNASEAPVMMGASPKMQRNELLAAKAGYGDREYSDFVLCLFEDGHRTEAEARPLVEADIGEELYPVSGESECGEYAASYDGLTMLEDVAFEHKMWNEKLAEAVRNKDLAPEYYWQLEHQLLVNPSIEKVVFVVSDGTRDNREVMEYRRVEGRAEQLVRGWAQFDADLENYEHEVIPAKPEPEPIKDFPALNVSLVGEVKSSNLPVFKNAALDYINNINSNLVTDQDFANAESDVKFCENKEKEIEVVKKAALAQTYTIEQLFLSLDEIKEALRSKRLALGKLVKQQKEQIRADLVTKGIEKFRTAVREANKEFEPIRITIAQPDFTGAIKGKRTVATLKGAVDDELARSMIVLNENRDHIRQSLKIIDSTGADYQFLFSDKQQLVDKPHDHLTLLVDKRVTDHKAAEQKRIDDAAAKKAEEIAAAQRKADQEEAERVAKAEREIQQQADATAPTSPPPEPDSNVKQMPSGKPRVRSSGNAPARPTDDQIIATLALHYRVHESKVIEWLIDMDLDSASERMAANI